MKRLLKWLGYLVVVLIVLILAGVGTVYAISSSRINESYPTAVETVPIPADPASLARGKHLVEAVGKCQACHGDNFAGKRFMDSPAFMRLTSANLTSGKGGIGSTYSDADYVRSIRHGIGRDGKSLLFMPSESYYHFNDADLGAIVAYLKTLPPAEAGAAPARSVGPIGRMVYLTTSFPLLPAKLVPHSAPREPDVVAGVTRDYGEYLSKAGGCTSCHGPALSGGDPVEGVKAANLTPGGEVGQWTEADFMKALKTGVRPNGTVISAVMPWPYTKNLTDDELRAMWMYVHNVQSKQIGEK